MKRKSSGKYKNKKTGGFASKKEHNRFVELQVLERCGEIFDLETQTEFELIPKQAGERAVTYTADFAYRDKAGKIVVEDVKYSFTRKLPVWIIKRKLMLWVHGIRVLET